MANWLEKFEEQLLVRELLDDHELPVSVCDHLTNDASSYLVSNVDDGVWKARTGNESNKQSTGLPNGAGVSILEKKGLDKMDYKYTLKIKSCGNALSDDGYKWRKYGQKSIKNSPYPRSYFRCTNPRCAAKKQVERCSSDPDTLIITYEGLHLHFTFSHSLSPTQSNQASPPLKKFKRTTSETQGDTSGQGKRTDGPPLTSLAQLSSTTMIDSQLDLFEGAGSQGLLEDMVPLSILKPSILNNKLSNSPSSPSTLNNLSNSSSSSPSYPSSPLTSSSSSLTWSPDFFSFDVGATSSIL